MKNFGAPPFYLHLYFYGLILSTNRYVQCKFYMCLCVEKWHFLVTNIILFLGSKFRKIDLFVYILHIDEVVGLSILCGNGWR